jgi:hypothetical protein
MVKEPKNKVGDAVTELTVCVSGTFDGGKLNTSQVGEPGTT